MIEEPKHRLQKARKEAGFATPSAAARAHPRELNKNTLISHENGNRDISRKAAAKYARLFGVNAGWILYGEQRGMPLLEDAVIDRVVETIRERIKSGREPPNEGT